MVYVCKRGLINKQNNNAGIMYAGILSVNKPNYFTNSLNFFPADHAGTVFAAIFKVAPV